jgi:hypothetical protein
MRERQPHHPYGLDQVPVYGAAPIVIRAIGDPRSSAATTDIVDQDINPAKDRDAAWTSPAPSSGLLTSAAWAAISAVLARNAASVLRPPKRLLPKAAG